MSDYLHRTMQMPDWLRQWLAQMSPGGCAWLNVGADVAIAVSSLLLFAVFTHFLRKRRAGWIAVFGLLGTFILFAGIANLTELFTLQPIVAVAKAAGALVCLVTTAALLPMAPRIMALRNPIEVQREIAQRRHTEMELRQVHAQLEGIIDQRTCELAAKNEEMEQFLNTVSHDLKNPIINCMGLIDMVREDAQAGRTAQTLDSVTRIERSMKRMRQLIEDLLNLSRIGRVRFELTEVDTQKMFDTIAEELALQLRPTHIELHVAENLPVVKADAHWLAEVFENLITNAIKYGCDNPQPKIVVGAVQEAKEIRFFVRDNGRGIDPAHHAQIFEPFRRLRSDKEGSGMGLAIVARIVKMHQGRIWIESQPGNGATFWVALPIQIQSQQTSPSTELELVH